MCKHAWFYLQVVPESYRPEFYPIAATPAHWTGNLRKHGSAIWRQYATWNGIMWWLADWAGSTHEKKMKKTFMTMRHTVNFNVLKVVS